MSIKSFNSVTEIIQVYKKIIKEPLTVIEKGTDQNENLCVKIITDKKTEYIPIRDCGASGYYLVEIPD